MTDYEREVADLMLRRGFEWYEVADVLGIPYRAIRPDTEKRYVRKSTVPVTTNECRAMREMRLSGMSILEIGKALGRDRSTVGRYCKGMTKSKVSE